MGGKIRFCSEAHHLEVVNGCDSVFKVEITKICECHQQNSILLFSLMWYGAVFLGWLVTLKNAFKKPAGWPSVTACHPLSLQEVL